MEESETLDGRGEALKPGDLVVVEGNACTYYQVVSGYTFAVRPVRCDELPPNTPPNILELRSIFSVDADTVRKLSDSDVLALALGVKVTEIHRTKFLPAVN